MSLPLICATGVAVLSAGSLSAPAVSFALILSTYYVVSKQPQNSAMLMLAIIIWAIAICVIPIAAFFMMVLLPTVFHTFIFTSSFLLVGYLKNNDKSAALTFILFISLGLSFFFIPHEWLSARYDSNAFPGNYFNDLASYLAQLTHQVSSLESASNIFAFLSFTYTYHYLNWFSKTKLIRWHEVSRKRSSVIVILYITAISSYMYDYNLGFKILLFLSLLHVLLEFPLNIKTFALIRKSLQQKLG